MSQNSLLKLAASLTGKLKERKIRKLQNLKLIEKRANQLMAKISKKA